METLCRLSYWGEPDEGTRGARCAGNPWENAADQGEGRPGSGDVAVLGGAMSHSRWSLWSHNSLLSIGSSGSVLSVLSVGSAGSLLSAWSAGSVGSIASAGSLASLCSAGSIGSAFSAGSLGAVRGARRGCPSDGAGDVTPRAWTVRGPTTGAAVGVVLVLLWRARIKMPVGRPGIDGWQVLGSNQRRLSRRIYSPLPLATRATCRAVCRRRVSG